MDTFTTAFARRRIDITRRIVGFLAAVMIVSAGLTLGTVTSDAAYRAQVRAFAAG